MKKKKVNKIWIKTRVFLSFGFFIIIIINILIFLFYNFIGDAYINDIKKEIDRYYTNIKRDIDQSETVDIISISKNNIGNIEGNWYFLTLSEKNNTLQKSYKKWYFLYGKELIFRGDYKNYHILIWKETYDLETFKKAIIRQAIIINIFSVFMVFLMTYFVTIKVLNPLLKLSKYIANYNIKDKQQLIKNNYGDTEIGIITESINKFITKSKETLEAQKKFIEDSSHELKTPLMQIYSNVELLEQKITDTKGKQKLENIKLSTDNINKIVSNLAFILRWREKITQKETINMTTYLKKFIQGFQDEADKKNIKIKLIETENFKLENSSYYLDRLFGNIIQNSIFYNDGNNEIIIEVSEQKVTIQDNWLWIEEAELEKIFSRFYRNKNSGLFNKDGNGLGLTIVKKICSDFWWKLELKSTKWKGTKILILF